MLDRLEGVFEANLEPGIEEDPVVGGANVIHVQNGAGGLFGFFFFIYVNHLLPVHSSFPCCHPNTTLY